MLKNSKKLLGEGQSRMLYDGKLHSNILGYVFLIPVVVILLSFIGIPMVLGIFNAFNRIDLGLYMEETWIGLKNFEDLSKDPVFFISVRNSLIFVLGSVSLHLVVGFALALMMDRAIRGRSIFRMISLMPWAMSGVAVGLIWMWLYHPQFSPINELLKRVGIISRNIVFLESANTAFLSVFIAHNWRNFTFAFIVILSGLQMIPRELYETAEIDGASALKKFIHITLPQMLSIILTVALLDLLWTFVYFDLPWVMTRGGPLNQTHLMTTYVYETAFRLYNFGKAAALSVIIFLLNLIIALLYIYYSKKAEEMNG